MTLAEEHLTTLLAIHTSDERIRESRKGSDIWAATIAETRELIALSRSVLAKPLPVGPLPLLAD